jgi:flagellar hook assembly protein FlgD
MKNKKIITYLLLVSLFFTQALWAQNIYLNFKNGNYASFALSDVRSITFTNDTVMNLNKWDGTTYSWGVNSITNYNYSGFTNNVQEAANRNDVLIYPNPGNAPVTIQYQLNSSGKVIIEITDINGKTVKTFSEKQNLAGNYTIAWDGKNANGSLAMAGVYLCKITTAQKTITKKLILTN